MVKKLLCYESCSFSPYYNLAIEQMLFKNLPSEESALFLWRNDKTVVIGRHQSAYLECNLPAMKEDNILLARRLTGGGAVYHDKENLNFTFLNYKDDFDLNRNFNILLDALYQIGICATLTGRNDITIEGKKFSGNAYFKGKRVCYHHGTLMIEVNVDALKSYLRVSSLKLCTKGVKSVSSRVINLRQISSHLGVEDLKNSIKSAYSAAYSLPLEFVSNAMWEQKNLKNEENFLSSREWLLGETPDFISWREERFKWGEVVMGMTSSGTIELYSDALEVALFEYIQKSLKENPKLPLKALDGFTSLQNEIITDLNSLLKSWSF